MFDGAQVLRIENVGTVLVLLDRHVAALALVLFLDQEHVAAGIGGRIVHLEIPAAGICARPLVGIAMIEVPGEQAAARVGDAKRAMNEHLEFGVGAFLTDFRDLFERQLTRQNDPADAGTGPEPHSGRVDGIGLHRKVDVYLRPGFANHHDQARVGHDQCVGAERDGGCHVAQVGLELGTMRIDIRNEIELATCRMGLADAFRQDLEIAEVVVANSQRIARLAGVDGCGSEGEGGAQHGERAGGSKQLRGGSIHGAGGLVRSRDYSGRRVRCFRICRKALIEPRNRA